MTSQHRLADRPTARLAPAELIPATRSTTRRASSTLDVLWVLYERVLDVSPETVDDPARDRFLLSKGHGPMAYYAVLCDQGFFPESWLAGWARSTRRSATTPTATWCPGVEISSGSLGHGLPLAVGTALGLRAQGDGPRVVVLVGDAELDEGSNHEAIELAGRARPRRADRGRGRQRSSSVRRARRIAAALRHRGLARRRRSTGATTTRWSRRCPTASPAPARRRRTSWRRSMTHATHARALQFDRITTDCSTRTRDWRWCYAEISATASRPAPRAPSRPGRQRRHPRAAAGQRRRRAWRSTGMRPIVHTFGRSWSSARSSRSSSASPTRTSAGCWSASAGRSTPPRTGRTHQAPGDVALIATLPGCRDPRARPPRRGRARCCVAPLPATGCTTCGSSSRRTPSRSAASGSRRTPGRRRRPLVLAVGPMLDQVLAATADPT